MYKHSQEKFLGKVLNENHYILISITAHNSYIVAKKLLQHDINVANFQLSIIANHLVHMK